jgi:NAD-dependent SIR2 family protein deacetylase
MTEHISFLFGSGFSATENIPTFGKDQITFFDKGATGVSYKEYMELVTRNNMTA